MPRVKQGRQFLRNRLWYEQAGHCGECREWTDKAEATLDHILPASLGGTASWGNAWMLCRRCNDAKGNMIPAHFLVNTS